LGGYLGRGSLSLYFGSTFPHLMQNIASGMFSIPQYVHRTTFEEDVRRNSDTAITRKPKPKVSPIPNKRRRMPYSQSSNMETAIVPIITVTVKRMMTKPTRPKASRVNSRRNNHITLLRSAMSTISDKIFSHHY
jgi:hypothetical protein